MRFSIGIHSKSCAWKLYLRPRRITGKNNPLCYRWTFFVLSVGHEWETCGLGYKGDFMSQFHEVVE